ncbi:MAG: hypothetical protein JWM19_1921 [Actinomycetia bacterium]|nr:hypothetical protein [Actinomycetes bacterium]
MRIPAKFTDSDLREAHEAADVVASEKFRPYLPGRLLPVLVARFRDDAAEALGMQLPPLPQRPPTRAAKLSELTSSEFGTFWEAVDALVERFAPCMDDPELPRLLVSLREELVAERAERERIADELAVKAKAS